MVDGIKSVKILDTIANKLGKNGVKFASAVDQVEGYLVGTFKVR
jgi:hypothetical protein